MKIRRSLNDMAGNQYCRSSGTKKRGDLSFSTFYHTVVALRLKYPDEFFLV